MRSTLPIAFLGACSSPIAGSDSRSAFVANEQDDSESNDDTADGRSHRVEPGDATKVPFGSRNELGRPWIGARGVPVFDCSLVPDEPTEINELDAPRGFNDVIFDTKGNLIGLSDNGNLMASPDEHTSDVWVPNVGEVYGMDWLPDGDMVAAGSELMRINPEDGKSVIAPDVIAYGVTVDPRGKVYVAAQSPALGVLKFDPEDGDWDEFVVLPASYTPRVIDFSPDYSKMYIGVRYGGVLFAVDLDKTLEPLGDPYVFADGLGNSYHDGLGVDVCGNVYVNDFSGSGALWRVSPGGDVSLLKEWRQIDGDYGYGHGQEWGSGLSVWRTDALYVPQPFDNNTVAEVVVGIPGRKYNNGIYEVINVDE